MTLKEFIEQAPAKMKIFEDATNFEFAASGKANFDPNADRPEEWWWREMWAYTTYQRMMLDSAKLPAPAGSVPPSVQ